MTYLYDWGDPDKENVLVDCLLPNSILITLNVPKSITILELKQDLWKQAKTYPLYDLLEDYSLYEVITYNQDSVRESLTDSQSLEHVRPIYPILQLVEKREIGPSIHSRINALLYKGNKEFEFDEEKEFTIAIRLYCEMCQKTRMELGWLEMMQCLYPPEIDTSQLSPMFLRKTTDRHIIASIRVPHKETGFCMKLCFDSTPSEILQLVLQQYQRKYDSSLDGTADDFTLRIFGRREYLIDSRSRVYENKRESGSVDPNSLCYADAGFREYQWKTETHPLWHYASIRKMIVNSTSDLINACLVLERRSNALYLEAFREQYKVMRSLCDASYSVRIASKLSERHNPRSRCSFQAGRVRSSADFRLPYKLKVHGVRNMKSCSHSQFRIRLCVYHGYQQLTQVITSPLISMDSESSQDEIKMDFSVVFGDLNICDLPRMARLCISLLAFDHSRIQRRQRAPNARPNYSLGLVPLMWCNLMIFDYQNLLKNGPESISMWRFTPDNLADESLLYPIGTVVRNPNRSNAYILDIAHQLEENPTEKAIPIGYPPYDMVLDLGRQLQASTFEDDYDIYQAVSVDDSGGQALLWEEDKRLSCLKSLISRDPLYVLSDSDKTLMWHYRHLCMPAEKRHSLPKLLSCVEWNDRHQVAMMLYILSQWQPVEPEVAIQLLDFSFADKFVRRCAVNWLKSMTDDEVLLYLVQLVQVLKYEAYLESELALFLLERALWNRRIGHRFFWILRAEMHDPCVCVKFKALLSGYCYGALDHFIELERQYNAINKIRSVCLVLQSEQFTNRSKRDEAMKVMQDILSSLAFSSTMSNIISPMDPLVHLHNVQQQKCRVMDSKMRPILLNWRSEDSDLDAPEYCIIYKMGDDLRQDMLTLHTIQWMDRMWKNEGLDLRMSPYSCLAFDKSAGVIEVVRPAVTLAKIQKERSGAFSSGLNKHSLFDWLQKKNPDKKLDIAIDEFTRSCAGYSVATYVLGIGDRHSDNIMLKENGQLFHIDFGHFLGNFKSKWGIKRERVPFVLVNSFVWVINGGQSQGIDAENSKFSIFKQYCEEAFRIIRRKSHLLIALFQLMLCTGMPELQTKKDLEYLHDALFLDCETEAEAMEGFRAKLREALKNGWSTEINWTLHNLAKDN